MVVDKSDILIDEVELLAQKPGSFTFITGPMFAGKSTALLEHASKLKNEGCAFTIVKWKGDARYHEESVCTHDGQCLDAVRLETLADLPRPFPQTILVDELQFFPDTVDLVSQWKREGINIVAAGIELNHVGKKFPYAVTLEPIATEVVRKVANCDFCATKLAATHTIRMTPVGKTWVGGKNDYKAACTECFKKQNPFLDPTLFMDYLTVEGYASDIEEFLGFWEVANEEEFAEMVASALLALRKGHQVYDSACGNTCCRKAHLDTHYWADQAHRKHLCLYCGWITEYDRPFVSNPLGSANCRLDEDTGLLELDFGQMGQGPAGPLCLHENGPPVQISTLGPDQVEGRQIKRTALEVSSLQFPTPNNKLPMPSKVTEMGGANLESNVTPQKLSQQELEEFLQANQLHASSDESTLAIRAYKLKEGLRINPDLVSPALNARQRREALQMLLDVAESFALCIEDLRRPAKGEMFEIDTGSHPPFKAKPYRLANREVEILDETLSAQLKGGIVSPSMSPWSSPCFVTYQRHYGSSSKPKPRKVVDYRRLNSITKADNYPLPDIPNLVEWLAGFEYFGALDLKSGYWQKQVMPQDRCKTAFVTPKSLLEYNRVAFGLRNAPAYFQREVNKMIAEKDLRNSKAFIDDLLTGGFGWNHYLQCQRQLFEACLDHSWLVTVSKVRIGYT